MRVVRNTGYIGRRRRAAKLMVVAGLLLLGGSWVLTLIYPDIIFIALAGLVFGFFFFNGGMQQIAKWSRNPRSDVVIDEELRHLNDRYTLIHYPDLPGRRPEHILVLPSGLMVMTTRELVGRMSVKGRSWRKLGNPLGRIFMLSTPQLGNPTVESEEQVKALHDFLEAEGLPGRETIEGVVLFVADNVEVEIDEPTLPVLHVTELLAHIRSKSGDVTIGGKEREQLLAGLSRGENLETNAVAPARPKKRIRAA
jgi:hypothetical protein